VIRFIPAALALLFAAPIFAANGDRCDAAQFRQTGGDVIASWCFKLVDDVTSASGGPIVFDLATAGPPNQVTGIPDTIVFEVGTDEDCSAGSVTFTTSKVSGGVETELAEDNPVLDLSGAATVSIEYTSPPGGFVNTRWTGVGGCTGGFDVLMIGYRVRR